MECVPLNEWKDWALSLEREKGKRQGESWSSSSTVKGFEPSRASIQSQFESYGPSPDLAVGAAQRQRAGWLIDQRGNMQDFDQEAKVHSPLQEVRDSMSTSTNVEPRSERANSLRQVMPEWTLTWINSPIPKRSNYSVFLGAFVFLPLIKSKGQVIFRFRS